MDWLVALYCGVKWRRGIGSGIALDLAFQWRTCKVYKEVKENIIFTHTHFPWTLEVIESVRRRVLMRGRSINPSRAAPPLRHNWLYARQHPEATGLSVLIT